MASFRDVLPRWLRAPLARGKKSLVSAARQMPEPVSKRLGSLNRSVSNTRAEAARSQFSNDAAYLDSVVASAITSAAEQAKGSGS